MVCCRSSSMGGDLLPLRVGFDDRSDSKDRNHQSLDDLCDGDRGVCVLCDFEREYLWIGGDGEFDKCADHLLEDVYCISCCRHCEYCGITLSQ